MLFRLLTRPPAGLGVKAGRLATCPASPNCVCTQADPGDATHRVEPFRFSEPPAIAWDRLTAVVAALPGARIRDQSPPGDGTPGYLRAECETAVLRFVDDLECLLEPETGTIHVRSGSRLGRTDFGANRRRVERLRQLFTSE